MLPLWCCFLTLSLVSASGTTFFFEEADALAGNHLNAILLFSNLTRLVQFVASHTSSYVIRKLRERLKYNQQKMKLLRIGIGTACCVLCCATASVTARLRQREYAPMSVYWLTPQYILLGLMMGLSLNGFESFYESQVSESLSTYGAPFVEVATGVGKFMSILCVLVFSRRPFTWFQRYLEDSSLDSYYVFLAVLSVVNVVIYCSVARWYGDDVFLVEDEETDGLAQEIDQDIPASSSVGEQHVSQSSQSIEDQLSAGAPTQPC